MNIPNDESAQNNVSSNNNDKKDWGERWGEYLGTALGIIGIAVFVYLVWPDARSYYPDQWFKPNFVIHNDLPETEMNAVNDLYAKIKPTKSETQYYPFFNHTPSLKELHPALKRYSRRSLVELIKDIQYEVQTETSVEPRFIRDDYFLKYSPKVEVVEWSVTDTGWTDSTKPRYLLKYCISNLTDCLIDKMIIRVFSEKRDSIEVYSGKRELRPIYDKEFTVISSGPMQPKHYQQYICAITIDDFSYIANKSTYGGIKAVYIK